MEKMSLKYLKSCLCILLGFSLSLPISLAKSCSIGGNKSLTLVWTPYSKSIVIRTASPELVQSLDDLDGYSVNLFAEFVKESCLNVTVKYIEMDKYDHIRHEISNQPAMGNIAFMNSDLASDFLIKNFQLSQVAAVFPGTVFLLEKDVSVDLNGGPIITFITFSLLLIIIGSVFLLIIVRLEKRFDPTVSAGVSESLWNFLLIPFGQSGTILTETPTRKFLFFTWILIWFWFFMTLSANFSSTLTVNKLKKGPETFKEVLYSDKMFFMLPLMMQYGDQRMIRDLTAKYEKMKDREKNLIYSQFEKETYQAQWGYSNLMTKLLNNDHIYLTCSIDLVNIKDQLIKDLNGVNFVIKNDWSVRIMLMYAFKTVDSDLFVSFDRFLQRKKSDGTLEELYEKWFSIDTFSQGAPKPVSVFDNEQLQNLCYMALIVSMIALVFCISRAWRQQACRQKTCNLTGHVVPGP